MKNVPQITATESTQLVPDGATLMAGGFGITGNPVHLLHALADCDTKNFTIISNNVGEPRLSHLKFMSISGRIILVNWRQWKLVYPRGEPFLLLHPTSFVVYSQ